MPTCTSSVLAQTFGGLGSALRRASCRFGGLARALVGPILVAATLALSSQPAAAVYVPPPYTYSYTGNGFTSVSVVGTPIIGRAYTSSDFVSAKLTLATALGANFPAGDISARPGLTLELTDGQADVTVSNSGSFLGIACVSTGADGNIAAWYLRIQNPNGISSDIYSYYDPTASLPNGCHPNNIEGSVADYATFNDLANSYYLGLNYDPQGTWQLPISSFRIGGTLAGLPAYATVVLQDNGGDNLSLGANGAFSFATKVANGSPYYVTVLTQPAGQFCAVSNGTGTVGGVDVTNVQVSCAPTTTYSYTGKHFTTFQCLTGGNPDCPSPSSDNPYSTSDSVTAGLTLTASLGNNFGPANVILDSRFVSLTLSDGLQSQTVTGQNPGGTAFVSTGPNGNLNSWYLDWNNSEGGSDIHTFYDPTGSIALACGPYCFSGIAEDRGSLFNGPGPRHYGYERSSPPGTFTPASPGGTVQLSTCTPNFPLPPPGTPASLLCNPTGVSPFAIAGPNASAIPPGATSTETYCVVAADPRGPNCGAGLNNRGIPRQLNVADIPQCKGFGNEVIPDYLCGASGDSGLGFALIKGVAEQLDGINGIYVPRKDLVDVVLPVTGSHANAGCTIGSPILVAVGATSTDSSVEEQEQPLELTLNGRPTLTDVTTGCDPDKGARSSGQPGHRFQAASRRSGQALWPDKDSTADDSGQLQVRESRYPAVAYEVPDERPRVLVPEQPAVLCQQEPEIAQQRELHVRRRAGLALRANRGPASRLHGLRALELAVAPAGSVR